MLAKKMIRDIMNNKIQFISIFLMAFLAVFVFTGISGEYVGLEVNSNNFYEETNLADGWIYSYYLNDMFLEQVWLLGPTTQMERQLVVDSVADLEDNPEITLHFVENNTISKFYLVEGKELDINDTNGVWLDKRFADARGLKVGDNISFECKGYEIEKEIKGLGYSPEYVFHKTSDSSRPDFYKAGFAYMSHKAFPEDTIPYNVLNVKFDGESDTFGKLLDYRFNGYYNSFIEKSHHPSVFQFENQIKQHKMMADILPIIFVLVSMLMLLTTMTRIITHQRTQIGILKSNGFKNKTISLHYISYGFWLVLAGSILGLILGPQILSPLFYPSMIKTYTLPSWNPVWSMNFVYLAALMIISSLAASQLAISSISNESPSDSIRPKAPKTSTSGFIERLNIWKALSFNIRWNYRDTKRNKLRGLMTIVGVIGCSALLVGAFGLYDGQNDLKEWEFNQINHYDSKLIIDENASADEIDNVAAEVNGDEIMEGSIELESNNTKKMGSLLVLNATDLVTPTDKNWNRMEIGNDEVSISQKMAELLGVGVGDTVKWHSMDSDKWVKTKINRIHTDPLSQGLIMSPDKLEELGLNYTPTSVITGEHVNKTYDGFKTINYLSEIVNSWDNITEGAWLLIKILIFFACLLAIVVLYNLGLMSFTEIEREIATLKVLGFKTNDLRRLLLTQNLLFTSVGLLIGIPLGTFILRYMWKASSEVFYLIPALTPTNVILTTAITFTLSIVVNLMFSQKIKKLDMVESLKGPE